MKFYIMVCYVNVCGILQFCIFVVSKSEEPNWLLASNADGKRGLIPANYIQWLN